MKLEGEYAIKTICSNSQVKANMAKDLDILH